MLVCLSLSFFFLSHFNSDTRASAGWSPWISKKPHSDKRERERGRGREQGFSMDEVVMFCEGKKKICFASDSVGLEVL